MFTEYILLIILKKCRFVNTEIILHFALCILHLKKGADDTLFFLFVPILGKHSLNLKGKTEEIDEAL